MLLQSCGYSQKECAPFHCFDVLIAVFADEAEVPNFISDIYVKLTVQRLLFRSKVGYSFIWQVMHVISIRTCRLKLLFVFPGQTFFYK